MKRQLVTTGAKWEAEVGYSRAVRAGQHVFISGTTAVDSKGRLLCQPDVCIQARRVFEIIAESLQEVGACLDDVVRTRMYVTDMADADALGQVHGDVFGRIRPAATLVEVSRLIDPRLRVEIEVEAIVGSGGADAVILAGGDSSRMGRDKSRIRLGRRTLLGHSKAALQSLGLKPRVVATDRQPGLGPLGGIDSALSLARHSRILFIGCDMPFLSGKLIDLFFLMATAGKGAMFTQHKKGVGFPFMLSQSDRPIIEKQISKGEFSLQRLAKTLMARTWKPSVDHLPELFNINTPSDLAEAKRTWEEAKF